MSPAATAAPAVLDPQQGDIRHDWSRQEVETLFALPFNDLLFRAHSIHRRYFDPNQVQVSTLLSIKTGACPGGLRLLPPEHPLRHGAGGGEVDGGGKGAGAGAGRPGQRSHPVLHGRRLAFTQAAGYALCGGHGKGRARTGAGELHDPGHAERRTRRGNWRRPGSTITTTISIPPRSSTATSSPRAPTRTACRPWPTCVRPA